MNKAAALPLEDEVADNEQKKDGDADQGENTPQPVFDPSPGRVVALGRSARSIAIEVPTLSRRLYEEASIGQIAPGFSLTKRFAPETMLCTGRFEVPTRNLVMHG